nr:uncharacterized protein LOC109158380 [Ipomoea batatas]
MDFSREESEQSTKEYGEDIEKNDSEIDSEYVGDEYADVIDDFEFDTHVDPNVEYVGVGDEKNEAIIEAEAVGKGGFSVHNLNDCPNLSDDASINEYDSNGSMKPRKKVRDPVHVKVELPPTQDRVHPTTSQEDNNLLIEAGYDPATVFSLEDLEWSQNNY